MSYTKTIGAIFNCALIFMASLPTRSCERNVASSTRATKSATERTDKVQTGVWGGQHIILEVTESGAKITYDCAHGTIDQKMVLNSEGRFDLPGTHVRELGGPVRSDHRVNSHPARYTGRIEGRTMTLTVTLTDTKESAGTFSLTHGEQSELTRCM